LFPGTLFVIGAEHGIGKSGVVLSALLETPDVAGGIFLEDGPDLVGGRALAYYAGVNSREFRFANRLAPGEVKQVVAAKERLSEMEDIHLEFALGGSIEEIEESVGVLGEKGCRIIYLDYLQKVRGVSENRRSEIGLVMQRFQKACLAANAVPVLATQLKRRLSTKENPEPRYAEPRLSDFKESGDIEAESRCALLLWPDVNEVTIYARLAKSSFGGEGGRANYVRQSCGSLKPVLVATNEWGEVA